MNNLHLASPSVFPRCAQVLSRPPAWPRQMVPLNAGWCGGMPDVTVAQQCGTCRWPVSDRAPVWRPPAQSKQRCETHATDHDRDHRSLRSLGLGHETFVAAAGAGAQPADSV